MKYTLILLISTLMLLSNSISAQQSACAPDPIARLFNGSNLDNWTFHLKDPAVDPTTVFMVKHAAIHITGEPFGYMRTREQYSNYKLHLEWRWPEEASNSGVFVHMQTPDAIWPPCIECQLKAGNAGDFVCMAGADMNERADKNSIVVAKMNPSNEVAIGDWNTMEVICNDNTIEVYVNGVLQNKATGVTLSKGFICLQSEGKAIEFRNIYTTKL